MKQETRITVVPIEIDPNLPEAKRDAIVAGYFPIYKQIQDLNDDYAAITQSDVTVYTSTLAKKARNLRLKLVAIRGKKGLKSAHAALKEDVKLEGQVIDLMERKPRELLQEWEGKLEEIEKHQEIEEARRIAELNDERLQLLEPYNPNKEDPALETLGELPESKWEEVFLEYRNAWEIEQERLRKVALREERWTEAKTYELYIDEFSEITWEALTPKQFKKIVSDATLAYNKQKESEAIAKKKAEEVAQKAAEEAKRIEEIAILFRKRVSLIMGAVLQEDGVYYSGKKIATIKSLETYDEDKFQTFLSGHHEKYKADEEAKRLRSETERQAEIERAASKARIEAEITAQKALEENARKEAQEREDRLLKHKKEAEEAALAAMEAPDSKKLMELAKALSLIEIPEFKTEKGIEIGDKFRVMQNKWVEGLKKVSSTIDTH